MRTCIKLTVTKGKRREREFVFGDRTICTVGRAHDCFLRVPDDAEHSAVSRHHCTFEIDPPNVAVRDVGSRNGTFVNGQRIGQRDPTKNPTAVATMNWPAYSLGDGDEVRLGDVVIQVGICAPAEEEAEMCAGSGV